MTNLQNFRWPLLICSVTLTAAAFMVTFYFYHLGVELHLSVAQTCKNPQKSDARLLISPIGLRASALDSDQVEQNAVVTDQSGESWNLSIAKKRALLLRDPQQLGEVTHVASPEKWKLKFREEHECPEGAEGRRCERLQLVLADRNLSLITTKARVWDRFWLNAQMSSNGQTDEVIRLMQWFAPGQLLLGMNDSLNCQGMSVESINYRWVNRQEFMVPSGFTKNYYTDLQKLPPEIRESIMRKQKVQILEAKPGTPVLTSPRVRQ
jgi:hypothetical protein